MGKGLIEDLNSVQREAVEYVDGPSLVIAGAGSGKTRVLTYKIAHLISRGIPAHKIIALTFTNKASLEMKERIDNLLGYSASKNLWMGTFHSLFGRILRVEAKFLGFTSNFTIYDTSDSLNLVKAIIKELNLNDEYYKPKQIFNRISACKNNLITANAYPANSVSVIEDEKENRPEFSKIFKMYTHRCRQSNVMDFDDLLLYTNILFKLSPEILNKYRSMFDYVLVDEYQDTNQAQYLIVKRLSEMHRKLFVVGDDAQSIYSFRGAKIQNILNFKNDYPDYKLFKLEQNYRSTQTIVNAANSLIKKNVKQIHKTVFSKNEEGSKIRVEKAMTDTLEGMSVARIITDMTLADHYKYSDFAILYRTNSQSRIMEESMRKYNIPYKIYGGLSFYQRKEIKDVIAYLRLASNHGDIEAFRRIINFPSRKIGATTVEKIMKFSTNSGIPVWDIVSNPMDYNVAINGPTKTRIQAFANLIQSFTDKIEDIDAYEFTVDVVNKTGVNSELFQDKTPEGVSRYENIQELLNGVKNFCDNRKKETEFNDISIADYLENVSLLTDQDKKDEEVVDRVSMMTIHSAKGLEYTNVFIVGVEENLFPNAMTLYNPKEIEEERRLFYVAITRAMKNLIICYSTSRYRFGKLTTMAPSRFVEEINHEFLEWPDKGNIATQEMGFEKEMFNFAKKEPKKDFPQSFQKKERPSPRPMKRNLVAVEKASKSSAVANPANMSDIKVGVKVKHHMFGVGKVIELSDSSNDVKAIILFEKAGQKTLLLKYAKLEILD